MGGKAPKAPIVGLCVVDNVGASVQVFVHTTSIFQPGGTKKVRGVRAQSMFLQQKAANKRRHRYIFFFGLLAKVLMVGYKHCFSTVSPAGAGRLTNSTFAGAPPPPSKGLKKHKQANVIDYRKQK